MTTPILQRLPDWPERLAAYIAQQRPHPQQKAGRNRRSLTVTLRPAQYDFRSPQRARKIVRGQPPLSPAIARRLLHHFRTGEGHASIIPRNSARYGSACPVGSGLIP